MDTFGMILFFVAVLAIIVSLIGLVVAAIAKKQKKTWGYAILGSFAVAILGILISVVNTPRSTTASPAAHYKPATPILKVTSGITGTQLTQKETVIHGTAKNAKYVTPASDGLFYTSVRVHKGKWSVKLDNTSGEKYAYIVPSNKAHTCGDDFSASSFPHALRFSFTKQLMAQGSSEMSSFNAKSSSESAASSSKSAAESSSKAAAKKAKNQFNPANYSTAYTYDQLARTPDQYKDKKVAFTGQVAQVMEGSDEDDLRVEINGSIDDVMLVGFDPDILHGSRILEGDKITFYGTSKGTTSYKSTMGEKITIPAVLADKISDLGKAPDDYEN